MTPLLLVAFLKLYRINVSMEMDLLRHEMSHLIHNITFNAKCHFFLCSKYHFSAQNVTSLLQILLFDTKCYFINAISQHEISDEIFEFSFLTQETRTNAKCQFLSRERKNIRIMVEA